MFKQASTKFLIDESVEYRLVLLLRGLGHNVVSISEEFPSISDMEVLKLAFKQKRTLITNDTGFGRLVFKEGQKSYGVILIRLYSMEISEKFIKLREAINKDKLHKLFITITNKQFRYKLLG